MEMDTEKRSRKQKHEKGKPWERIRSGEVSQTKTREPKKENRTGWHTPVVRKEGEKISVRGEWGEKVKGGVDPNGR